MPFLAPEDIIAIHTLLIIEIISQFLQKRSKKIELPLGMKQILWWQYAPIDEREQNIYQKACRKKIPLLLESIYLSMLLAILL